MLPLSFEVDGWAENFNVNVDVDLTLEGDTDVEVDFVGNGQQCLVLLLFLCRFSMVFLLHFLACKTCCQW